jgi:hypothetical protein
MALEVFPFGEVMCGTGCLFFPFCFFQVLKRKMPKNHETSCGGHFLTYRMETSYRQSNKIPISQMRDSAGYSFVGTSPSSLVSLVPTSDPVQYSFVGTSRLNLVSLVPVSDPVQYSFVGTNRSQLLSLLH